VPIEVADSTQAKVGQLVAAKGGGSDIYVLPCIVSIVLDMVE